MDKSVWLEPQTWTGVVGIALGAASLLYTRQVEKRQAKAERPSLDVHLASTGDGPNWYALTMILRNPSQTTWRFVDLAFPGTPDVRGIPPSLLIVRGADGVEVRRNPNNMLAFFNKMEIDTLVGPQGATGEPRDQITLHAMLLIPRARQKVKLLAKLEPLGAGERPVTLSVTRVIPS